MEVMVELIGEIHSDQVNVNEIIQRVNPKPVAASEQESTFSEIKRKHHKNSPPKHLQ